MASEAKPLTGPDLHSGVPWDQLADGVPLLGHVAGEAVILVRRGQEAFATGATCTHYSGPLAEGLVVGNTVRCPWHHACFDLRTGEAVGAPALNPIPCYEVKRDTGLVSVGRKREGASPGASPGPATGGPPARSPGRVPSSVVIVGAGPAGAACAEALRREGYVGPITLVGDEPPGPVDRPNLSKDFLAGTAPEEWLPLRSPEFYAEQKIAFIVGENAEGIDTTARTVTLASGRVLPWGALVLATGAEPRRLSVPGADRAHVHTLRSLADSKAIIAGAAGSKRAVVIGASFIGLEVAASLRQRGLEVDVVAPDPVPLGRTLGDEIGAEVRRLHESHGVRFHLGETAKAIGASDVELSGGGRLPAELVVVGVGVAPRTKLAEAAGLRVDNGIVVDELLRASANDVFAAGDVARHPDPRTGALVRIEHFVVAERQGQAAARSVLGVAGGYKDVPFFWSQHYDVGFSYVGHAAQWDRIETRGSLAARDFAAFYLHQGRVLAVVTVGRDHLGLRAEAAMQAADETALAELLRER